MRLVAPPVSREQFIAQSYLDSEYWRRFIPGTLKLYSSRDGATGKRCHAAYDINDVYSDRRIFACYDGKIDHHYDSALGYIIRLIDTQTKGGLWYCHLAKRYAKDGATVKAGTEIALMGQTGNANGIHLHLPASRVWNDYRTLYNYGPLLRSLKEALMPLNDADRAQIRAIVREEVQLAADEVAKAVTQAINVGGAWGDVFNHPDPKTQAALKANRETYNLKKVLEKP